MSLSHIFENNMKTHFISELFCHIFKNNMKTHFISELFCHESYQVHISNGFPLDNFVAMATKAIPL